MEPGSRPLLKLRISPVAETLLRKGHPWLFADSVRSESRPGETGELAVVFDRNNRFLAVGLYDAESPIRLRVLHRGRPARLDVTWWRERFREAAARRVNLSSGTNDAYRVIHGENDGWPGMVLDRYADTAVMKIYTAAWLPHLVLVLALVEEQAWCRRVVLRLSRNIAAAAQQAGYSDGMIVRGGPLSGPVTFQEDGLRFEADVVRGQKTGFFLDQRENRRRVESFASGREVLNAFSFSGGFSLYAARGGATRVVSVDISRHALEGAVRNFALNQADTRVMAARHETVQADVFEWMKQPPPGRFGVVVLDPPSLARRETERADAIRAYAALARGALKLLDTGGILVAASCSAHVTADEFFGAVRGAIEGTGRSFNELDRTRHPSDHPAAFPEAEYLKCIYLALGDSAPPGRPQKTHASAAHPPAQHRGRHQLRRRP